MTILTSSSFIRRIGSNVTKLRVGDRVCVLKPGTYANRVHTEADRCHLIPASMSYEDASTIPSVYLCSLYALYHLANIQEGQVSNFSTTSQIDAILRVP